MGGILHRLFLGRAFFALSLALLLLTGVVPSVCAATLAKEEVRSVLQESTQALLSGSAFSPALEEKQQALRETLQSGAIKRAELSAMLEESIVPILEKHRTSRYILKDLPAKFDKLVAPYMEWEEVKAVVWKACSALIPDGEQLMLKIGTLAPPGTPWLNVPETLLVPQMAKLSNNKVVIKIYGGGTMGEDTDILRKMDIGQLEGCGCTALGILAASPETAVLLLPGLFNNYDEIDYIYEKFRRRLDRAFEEKGYILAALIDTGFFHVFTKNKITGLADLKKQKVLTWFGIMETTLFRELGIDATPVAVPEVVSALSTGLANANLAPAAWMLGMQAYQYANYYTTPALLYSPAAVVVSTQTKDRFRKQFGMSELFADNITELLVYEVSTLETEWRKQIRDYDAKSLKAFEAKCGMKPVVLSQADRQALEKAAKGVQAKLAGKAFPEDLMNEIIKALEDYRAGGTGR
ncbi:TRAP transporter substrate-binding protein DctP [Desulfosudis oleivorans]|uniref:TRAP dicarboxylate transporter-DctP subunit n=1 Tax=Desulfosudis oleivorans (strain DSM 6200 / JCM 39069 / Hxd3) TaxID=96561 RepID=A8ZZK9_DESOH|nr:TRAP transporter substrate-binding protein DctP [Desulfosudis oleivorans]ABW68881.1 TRAP dicarboxylate transporter- DctP subunit [Desulfosudis oleivorans Hxd3]